MADEYNAAERKKIRAAEKRARIEEAARREVIKSLMSGTAGRSWVYDILLRAHLFEPSFSDNPLVMAFKEGERNFGLALFSDIMTACPQYYIQMMEEKNERHDPEPTGDLFDDDDDGSGGDSEKR